MCALQAKAQQLMGMLAVSVRHVDSDGKEIFDDQKIWLTGIICDTAEAAQALADRVPAPSKP